MGKFFDKIKGYKTMAVNAVVMLLGLLQAFGVVDTIPSAADISTSTDQILGGATSVYAGVNMWLRYVTSTSFGSS